jgi:hypothetical protein
MYRIQSKYTHFSGKVNPQENARGYGRISYIPMPYETRTLLFCARESFLDPFVKA